MLQSPFVLRLVRLALEEDMAYGDVTSSLTIAAAARSRAVIIAREPLLVCGVELITLIASQFSAVEVDLCWADGKAAKAGDVLARLEGSTRELLGMERTVLNFLQRLSGIATHTRAVVDQAQGLTLLDSRKTTPGWRILEKYAVTVGGARNHRISLGDMILVKNNHVDACGGDMRATLAHIAQKKGWAMPVEVEVRNLDELRAALEFNPNVVMLDNMKDGEIEAAMKVVATAARPPLVEVSGSVTPARFAALRALGVDAVSLSMLIGQARTVDISMRIEAE